MTDFLSTWWLPIFIICWCIYLPIRIERQEDASRKPSAVWPIDEEPTREWNIGEPIGYVHDDPA